MPKLTMFVVCDSVGSFTPQPNVSIPQLTGPQVVLRPVFIPGTFSFGIAAGVLGVDLKHNNEVQFTIKAPNGSIIQDSGKSSIPILAAIEEDVLPDEYQGFMLTLDVRNLIIEEEGVYTFTLMINDEIIGSHEIPIFTGKRK